MQGFYRIYALNSDGKRVLSKEFRDVDLSSSQIVELAKVWARYTKEQHEVVFVHVEEREEVVEVVG